MLQWIKSIFRKEKWVLVKIISEDWSLAFGKNRESCTLFYRLYESNKNNRRVEMSITHPHVRDCEFVARQSSLYHQKILRWKDGRLDPEIPSYNDIHEEDLANVLRGKI